MLSQQQSTPIIIQESAEAKRKSAKRNTKSDKELLEFTLQYQKVLAERDAGKSIIITLEILRKKKHNIFMEIFKLE